MRWNIFSTELQEGCHLWTHACLGWSFCCCHAYKQWFGWTSTYFLKFTFNCLNLCCKHTYLKSHRSFLQSLMWKMAVILSSLISYLSEENNSNPLHWSFGIYLLISVKHAYIIIFDFMFCFRHCVLTFYYKMRVYHLAHRPGSLLLPGRHAYSIIVFAMCVRSYFYSTWLFGAKPSSMIIVLSCTMFLFHGFNICLCLIFYDLFY